MRSGGGVPVAQSFMKDGWQRDVVSNLWHIEAGRTPASAWRHKRQLDISAYIL